MLHFQKGIHSYKLFIYNIKNMFLGKKIEKDVSKIHHQIVENRCETRKLGEIPISFTVIPAFIKIRNR